MDDQSKIKDFADTAENGQIGKDRPYKNESWLRKQYYKRQNTEAEIAELADVHKNTIRRWMDKYDIERRSPSEAQSRGNIEPLKDPDWLREQYRDERKTPVEIGNELGLSYKPVDTWLDKHGIEKRSVAEAQTEGNIEPLKDQEWLREQYWDYERTLADIADDLNVTDVTVNKYMKKHGIERRDTTSSEVQSDGDIEPLKDPEWLEKQYVENELSASEIGNKLGVSKTPVLRYMNEHGIEPRSIAERNSKGDVTPLRDADWLYEQYVEEEKSQYEIADELSISAPSVRNWMDRHGIEPRPEFERNSKGNIRPLRDEEWLREQYTEQGRSTIEIAGELGVTVHPVRDYLDEYGIEIRSNEFDPDHLPHRVRSTWELTVANLLSDAGVDYEYESLEIEYGDGRIYTPDFVTDHYVIEVKGHVYSNEVEKANAAMDYLDERKYVVIGRELPADVHIKLKERAAIHSLFE